LFRAAAQLAELEPWQFASDAELFGVADPASSQVRIGHVLGNGGMVYGVVIYRNGGIRWVLSMLGDDRGDGVDVSPDAALEAMDFVKLEWVHKRDLEKEDLAALAASGIKVNKRGAVWPQFRSGKPGWHPWHIDAQEARQLHSDLLQLTALVRLYKSHPGLFEGRAPSEVPFLRGEVPNRELSLDDLKWISVVPPHDKSLGTAVVDEMDLKRLNSLKKEPGRSFDFDARLLPEASFLKDGRPCFGRMALLVESDSGVVADFELQAGDTPTPQAVVSALVLLLLKVGIRPARLNVKHSRFTPGLESLCLKLGIQLVPAEEVPLLDEGFDSLAHALTHQGSG
jgi:hypothetical protein